MRYLTTATVYASVEIKNQDVTERVTGTGGDEWRSQFYRTIETAEDVIEHFAFNAITNGVHDITTLDGWADCDPNDAVIEIDDVEFSTEVQE